MAKQAKDHETVAKPGKSVSDAISSRVEGHEPASDEPHAKTPPGKGKDHHLDSQKAGRGASVNVPGRAVPGAIRGSGKR